MPIPTLETERLIIREYTLADLDARHSLMTQAFGGSESREAIQAWLDWTVRNYRELAKLYQPPYGDYALVLKETGMVIGSVGLVPSIISWGSFENPPNIDPPLVTPEFGLFWGILPEYWGKGCAPESARAVIDFVFSQMNVRRMVAQTDHDNLNSQRVMEKLGMRLLRNATQEPFWLEVVGVLDNPILRS
jgi:[ribosomal protein S5]-alanine N-acetyltransferase